jgi:flagellar basal-body rod protein FlgC
MSGLFGALDISGSGMTAERLRMDTIANNLANANTTRTAAGGPYRREEVVLQAVGSTPGLPGGFSVDLPGVAGGTGGGVEVGGIVQDQTPFKQVYDPGNPDANKRGYVLMPNVNAVTEMTDMITATRAYEANATAVNAVKGEAQHALDVLR